METVWLAIDKKNNEFKVHKFAETARNTLFERIKNELFAMNAELPEAERLSEEALMEEANEEVIQAEDTPWLSRYAIKEVIVED
jgi:hypothetical protein